MYRLKSFSETFTGNFFWGSPFVLVAIDERYQLSGEYRGDIPFIVALISGVLKTGLLSKVLLISKISPNLAVPNLTYQIVLFGAS